MSANALLFLSQGHIIHHLWTTSAGIHHHYNRYTILASIVLHLGARKSFQGRRGREPIPYLETAIMTTRHDVFPRHQLHNLYQLASVKMKG